MEPTLKQIESLALAAGKILRGKFGGEITVTRKGVIDLVTEVDQESEDFLVREIRSQYPHHRIITEEQGDLGGEDSRVWYIDPLDPGGFGIDGMGNRGAGGENVGGVAGHRILGRGTGARSDYRQRVRRAHRRSGFQLRKLLTKVSWQQVFLMIFGQTRIIIWITLKH